MALPPEITTVAEAIAYFTARDQSREARLLALEGGAVPQPIPVAIAGTPPTTGTVGQPYSFTPTVSNGMGTKAFLLASGTLLGGLSFSTSTGAISGSPTVAGTMSGLSVRVTDSTGNAATTPTTVTIAAAAPVPDPTPVTGDPMAFAARSATPFDMQFVNGSDGPQAGVDGNGWVGEIVFKGMAADKTFDATKITIVVQDPGFDSSGATVTRTRTIKGGTVLRRQVPNAGQKAIDAQGADVIVQFSLSDTIYAGTSIQSVTVAAGAYGTSNAKVLTGGTNNSTRAYGKPTFGWLSMPYERAGAATMKVEAVAFSKFARLGQQVACIQYTATDGTNTTPVVTSGAALLSTFVTKGQPPECYPASLNLGTLTANGADCTVNARVLPWIGDETAVLDVRRDGAVFDVNSRNNWFALPFKCDRTGTWGGASAFVKVGATGGAAHIDPATARTTPFPHLAKALEGLASYNSTRAGRNTTSGSTIYFMDDGAGGEVVHSFGGDQTGALPGARCWVDLSKDPAATGNVGMTGNNSGYEQYWSQFRLKNFKLYGGTPGGLNILFLAKEDTAGGYLALDNCEVHSPGNFGVAYAGWVFARNVEFRNRSGTATGNQGGMLSDTLQCLGVVSVDDTNATLCGAVMAGCKMIVPTNGGWGAQPNIRWDGMVVTNNYFNCGTVWFNGNVNYVKGITFVQNLIDNVRPSTNGQLVQVLADGAGGSIDNFLEMHNTVAGERGNFLYCDEDRTVGSIKRGFRVHSIWHNWNNKRDTFTLESATRGRTGNWEWAFGVGMRGMVSLYGSKSGAVPDASSYLGDYWSPDSLYQANGTVTFADSRNDPAGSNGTYGGNYHLTGTTNGAYGRVASGMGVLAFDFDGAARRNNGTGAAGAFERTQ